VDVSLDRLGKPYVTNGVAAELVETFLSVPTFSPSVHEAFGGNVEKPTPLSSQLKRKGGPVPGLSTLKIKMLLFGCNSETLDFKSISYP